MRVRPVGAHREIPINVRVIAATNSDAREEIAYGRFRHDLFYRIALLTIRLPPLSQTGLGHSTLVEHFCARPRRI